MGIMESRLARLNKIMGTKYADMVEASSMAEGCVEEKLMLGGDFEAEEFDRFCDMLARYWPSFIRYHEELERNSI